MTRPRAFHLVVPILITALACSAPAPGPHADAATHLDAHRDAVMDVAPNGDTTVHPDVAIGPDAPVGVDDVVSMTPPDGPCVATTCAAHALHCGPLDDGCGHALDCGSCADPATCGGGGAPGTCGRPAALPYPTRTTYRIKSLQPDYWPDHDEIAGNNTGGVAMNLLWAAWEPTRRAPPCGADVEYDGHCFTVDAAADGAIRDWSTRGLVVTAVAYGSPAWARTAHPCTPVAPGYEIFCAPDNVADYARFMGMIARRYDGMHGNGRAADFVIWNEVNSNDWFDVGCGQSAGACDANTWIAGYASLWSAAYDAVVAEQSTAKVLTSFEHHFGTAFDAPGAASPLLSVQTFLLGFAPRVAPRPWRVAYHPYAPDLTRPAFSADDFPLVTYGNLGVLLGWLARTFPAVPSALEVQLTESGISSLTPHSSPAAQASAICDSFRNVLGTPGIQNYVYHRMVDNPSEVAGGLALGLRNADHTPKPAWATWALANRSDLAPPMLSCGFEDVPYTRLSRSFNAARGHWASSRIAPAGFAVERAYHLQRDPVAGGVMLYECGVGSHNFLTRDVGCEGQTSLGPVGYALAAGGTAGTVALYRCRVGAGVDHFISTDAGCEGQTTESLLGYVWN